MGKLKNPLVNIELGKKIIDFKTVDEFYKLSYQNIEPENKEKIF